MIGQNAIWTEIETVIGKLRQNGCTDAANELQDSLRSGGIRSELLGKCAETVNSLLKNGDFCGGQDDLLQLKDSLRSELRKFGW